MAEMTVEEAVRCIQQNIHYYEVDNYNIIDVDELIIALLTQQQQEIEVLKCCGNCKRHIIISNDSPRLGFCDLDCKFGFGDGKCDSWERMRG